MLLKSSNHEVPGFTKADEGEWSGSYTFIHGADPQFGFIDLIKGGGGKKWDEEKKLLKQAIDAINKMSPRPKFFFICGDLIDAFPGVEPTNELQTKDFLELLTHCHVPIMVISGNHDIGNKPTDSSIIQHRDRYGDDYYSFYAGGVFYIALNSQYFMDQEILPEFAKEQMEWLDQKLEESRTNKDIKHTVVFMHIPLFLESADEKNQYFSVPKPLRTTLLEKFANAGVRTILSGHYHRNAGGTFTTTVDGNTVNIQSVVTSAIGAQLGKDKSGVGVVSVTDDSVSQTYYAMDDIPPTTEF